MNVKESLLKKHFIPDLLGFKFNWGFNRGRGVGGVHFSGVNVVQM